LSGEARRLPNRGHAHGGAGLRGAAPPARLDGFDLALPLPTRRSEGIAQCFCGEVVTEC